MNNRKTTEDFIRRSIEKHGDKYDYSLSNYITWNIKVKIICPEHGEFEQLPTAHMSGQGCKKCFNIKIKEGNSSNTKEFIEKCKIKHGDKYDYSLVEYEHSHKKVKIICPIHGVFEQKPFNHLSGYKCHLCNKSVKLNTKTFIEKCEKIHNNKYDYSLVEYKNSRNKIKIICDIHGVFEQLPGNHIKGGGCEKCDNDNRKIKLSDFIILSNNIHSNKYDYSIVDYVNSMTKIKIICPEHGIFEQTPHNHTISKNGCPLCKESKGERKISNFLKKYNYNFIREFTFEDCKNIRPLPFDFYLPDHNICIEYDGIQHFEIINNFFGGKNGFNGIEIRDGIKNEYCLKNNIRLIRIKYDQDIKETLIKLIQN